MIQIPVPQADDLDKVFEVVQLVADGHTTSVELADALEMVERQGFYYAAAAEQMGLIERAEGEYSLTQDGRDYLNKPSQAGRVRAVFQTPVMKYLADQLGIKRPGRSHLHLFEDDKFVSDNIEELGFARETVYRRATTIKAWMKSCA